MDTSLLYFELYDWLSRANNDDGVKAEVLTWLDENRSIFEVLAKQRLVARLEEQKIDLQATLDAVDAQLTEEKK